MTVHPAPRSRRRRTVGVLGALVVVPAVVLGGALWSTADGDVPPTAAASQPITVPPAPGLPEPAPDTGPVPASEPPPEPGPPSERQPGSPSAPASEPAAEREPNSAPRATSGTERGSDVDQAALNAVTTVTAAAAAEVAGGALQVVLGSTDDPVLAVGPGADEPVPAASLVKLLVIQQLFTRDAAGSLTLDGDALDEMERAVTQSDDSAMNTLWTRFDGEDLVTAAADEFGLTGTAGPVEAGQWGESTTTGRDYAAFLAGLSGSLEPADAATLTGWMQSTTDIAADGFDQDFGLLSPTAGTVGPVAAKQGWMCCVDDRRQLHSTGVLADGRVVVLLGDFPDSTSWAKARSVLSAAAQALISGT
jgi:hypothetical protein